MLNNKKMNLKNFNNTEITLEMSLLLSCSCVTISEKQKNNIYRVIHKNINWNRFIQLVNYNQINPIVYFNLQKYVVDGVPPQVLKRLKTQCKKQKIHSLKLTAELVRIVKLCSEEGIKVICLKGPVLARQLYGDIALRHIVDIDLLVDIQDIKKIHLILIRQGYETGHPELFSSSLHWKVFKKSKHHVPYHQKGKMVYLELHFRLFKNIHVFTNNQLKAWDNPQSLVYAGVTLNTLSTIDNVLFLFVHGSIHKWHLLKWLADIAQLSHSQCINWEKLLARAVETGLQRPVVQGLLLLNHFFAIPLPGIFTKFPISKPILKMTCHALAVIMESRENVKSGFFFAIRERFYLLKLKPELKYKLRYLRDLVYLDSHRKLLRLPSFLFPLYFVLNPFLWFYKNYIRSKILPRKGQG